LLKDIGKTFDKNNKSYILRLFHAVNISHYNK
jgi:hypothetical protein